MRNFKLLLGVGISGLLLSAWPSLAEVTTSIKNKTAEITIKLDDSLKAYPKLFENLAAEGKVWATKADLEAEMELKELPKRTASASPWSYERSYNLRSAIGPYISVLRQDYTFTGGAHPNRYTDTILWDRDAGKRMSVRPFFKETEDGGPTMTALAGLVRAALEQEKKRRGAPVANDPTKDDWLRSVKPWLLKLGPISLAPSTERDKSSGLSLHFSPYMVGPYVEGDYVVFIPWTDLKPYLSAQGGALFGGTRAPSDKDQQP
jgi:hypothetical protein